MFRQPFLAAGAFFGIFLALGTVSAFADSCSHQDHSGGALPGRLAGNALSQDMSCDDRPYAARAYDQSFRGPIGPRTQWQHGADRGYIVTNREYWRGRRLCRDFTQVVYRHGHEFDRDGTACRGRDGSWELMPAG